MPIFEYEVQTQPEPDAQWERVRRTGDREYAECYAQRYATGWQQPTRVVTLTPVVLFTSDGSAFYECEN